MRWIAFIGYLLISAAAFGQQYGFRQYSLADGVAQSQVFALLEDHQGYLWLGTQGGGLNRWDGLTFQRFSVKEGLGNGKVYALFQDRDHNIWVGTQGGLYRFNGRNFTRIPAGSNQLTVLDVVQLPSGQLIAGTSEGLWECQQDSLIHLGELNTTVRSLAMTGDTLWAGTNAGLRLYQNGSPLQTPAGINRGKPIETVRKSPGGELWIAGYGNTVFQWDHQRLKEVVLPFPATLVTDFAWNHNGDMWVASQDQGVVRRQARDSSWTTFGISDGLPNRYVRSLLVDSWDNLWLGTSGSGLCQYTGLPFVYFDQKNGLPEQAVYSLLEDRDCRIWMGNGQTVGYLENEQFVGLRDLPGFRRTKNKSILQDTAGRIWIGTEGNGVGLITDSGFVWFDQTNGLASPWVRSLALGPDGRIWVGTASSGLSVISWTEDTTGIQWNIDNIPIAIGGLNASINQIQFDEAGNLWMATRNFGLLQWNNGTASRVLPGEQEARDIRSMAMDHDGRFWLGTADAGVLKAERAGDSIQTEWYRDELTSTVVYLLAFDEYGSLWIGSEQGMDRATIDEAGNLIEVEHFGPDEGFLGIETTQNASLMDREGRMWFGTVNGLGRWQAGLRQKDIQPPRLVLEQARLFYTDLRSTRYDSLLNSWNEFTGKLILPHDRNHLSFDLLGIDHDRPEEVLYQWKLIGSEPEWTPASARRTATFSNLAPGTYEFQARAGFSEGVWSDYLQIRFTIKPPFWNTWWFRGAFLLLIALIILSIFRFRIQQERARAATERQRLEMERDLIELEQKALRLQMNPHFIFNALNSIQALIARQDPKTSRYYLSKFSRLMRQVLENSRHSRVSLEQELQVLEDYLELERFSRGESFDYTIEVADDLDPEEEMVPPMLLQPFLENAIIHGVAHLQDRKGQIDLRISRQHEQLVCEVRDNGVGRAKAAHMKSQQQAGHKSMALQVTQERLERLATQGQVPELVVEDLVLPDGEAGGTLVRLTLPVA